MKAPRTCPNSSLSTSVAGTAAQFTQDLAPKLPATSVSGTNLLDPSTFHYTGVAYRTRPFDGAVLPTLSKIARIAAPLPTIAKSLFVRPRRRWYSLRSRPNCSAF